MRPIVVSVLVPASASAVWAALADIERHSDWMADAQSIEFMSDTRSGPGTRIGVATRVGPLRSLDVMEFDRWDPPREMGVRHVGRVRGRGSFRLSPRKSATEVTWREELEFPLLFGGRLGMLLARPILRRIFTRNLRRFAGTFAPEQGEGPRRDP